jgi:chorismate--pyruvate lyase
LYAVQAPRYHLKEPKWRDYRHYTRVQLPAATRPWLLDTGSLTQRLVTASGGAFKVVVLSQQWQRPKLSESRLLGIAPQQQAIIREVMLLCHDTPAVFARSIIPATSLTGRLRHLRHFDNSSLGELLFRDTSMRRHPFQLARITGDSGHIPNSLHQPGQLWWRRSRFDLAGKPLIVSEIFLNYFHSIKSNAYL